MKEFRKIRIQREVSEILASIDQVRRPPPRITPAIRRHFSLPPRQIGLALFSCLLGVLMGQSIAMKALETGSLDDYQFTTVG